MPKRLQALPQRFDIWQVDSRPTTATLRTGEGSIRPWLTVVVSHTDAQVLGLELTNEEPTPEEVWQVLAKAMREPVVGEPHRPTAVQIANPAWASSLAGHFQGANVDCQVAEELDQIDEVFDELAQQLPAHEPVGLLDMPGVTPDAVGNLFDAAGLFYHQSPWKKTGERPVQVACDQFQSGPWYAVIMGQGGMTRGLVLYDSREALRRVQEGNLSEEENARLTTGLVLTFGEKEDLVDQDIAAMRQHGWKVAAPDAYPSVYRLEPGLSMRPPLAWELRLLEGCLRAIPEFVRKKSRRLVPLSITVPTAEGDLPLVLSWADN